MQKSGATRVALLLCLEGVTSETSSDFLFLSINNLGSMFIESQYFYIEKR